MSYTTFPSCLWCYSVVALFVLDSVESMVFFFHFFLFPIRSFLSLDTVPFLLLLLLAPQCQSAVTKLQVPLPPHLSQRLLRNYFRNISQNSKNSRNSASVSQYIVRNFLAFYEARNLRIQILRNINFSLNHVAKIS